ncbi:MAG: UDP-N-acetylmuramate--L-alanine ligase [Chloroflexota bacterium]|nr:UDP-N-acetylmuramate--L-alanine ligase [Chloroflexota bacterium]
MKHVHFIGIGGTGLSAIARVLLEKGYAVSGSDREASPLFKAITDAGARTYLGHAAEQIAGADLVIRSSAIPDNNPEVIAARAQEIPVLKRADFLKELTKGKETIAVAGSHGKTTTTAMLTWILEGLGTQPSFISGGMVNQLGCNARAGAGAYFVIEADEFDYMFLGLSPKIAIVTNIEHDHPDCFPTESDYLDAFSAFLARVRPDGFALMCLDDPQSRTLFEKMKDGQIQLLSYGTSPNADYYAHDIKGVDDKTKFILTHKKNGGLTETLGTIKLSVPGHHNVLNATAVLGAVHQLEMPIDNAILALNNFQGTGRRFEILGNIEGRVIIDDYGHHPTQIAATLEAARSRYPHHRIFAVWQPHTYSRTQWLEKEYVRALSQADKVIVLKIYAAREKDEGYTAKNIAQSIADVEAHYIPNMDDAANFLLAELKPNDLVIVFSAGDATKISRDVLRELQRRFSKEQDQP